MCAAPRQQASLLCRMAIAVLLAAGVANSDEHIGSGRHLALHVYGNHGESHYLSSSGPRDEALLAKYEALVMAPAKLHGKVEKQGAPDFQEVIGSEAKQRADDELLKWMWEHVLGFEDGSFKPLELGAEAPVASNCIYLYNPHYKFVFIKNTKVAGTSVGMHFGMFCKPDELNLTAQRKNCLWTHGDILNYGLSNLGYSSLDELWMDYTVFTLSRNPFDRAASSYHYCLKRRGSLPRQGMCTNPSFKHFCQRPYILGLQAMLFKCMIEVPGGAGPKHDFGHVMPQATCLINSKGQRVIDWVLRIDHLSEDLFDLCSYLNQKRNPSVVELPVAGLKTVNVGPGSSAHGLNFYECGQDCLTGVARYYKQDFDLFGFPRSLEELEHT